MNEYTRNMLKSNFHLNMAKFWLGLEKWMRYFSERAANKGNAGTFRRYDKKFYKYSQKYQKNMTKSEDYFNQARTFRMLTE